jgi:dUTP pyrophosphatase
MIAPGETKLVSTGLRIHLNTPDYAAILAPRSGLGVKNGIVLANLVGVVDGDYTGPLMVALWNRGSTPYRVFVGEKIAQMLIVPVAQATFNIRDEHIPSGRGDGGFGSTGAM